MRDLRRHVRLRTSNSISKASWPLAQFVALLLCSGCLPSLKMVGSDRNRSAKPDCSSSKAPAHANTDCEELPPETLPSDKVASEKGPPDDLPAKNPPPKGSPFEQAPPQESPPGTSEIAPPACDANGEGIENNPLCNGLEAELKFDRGESLSFGTIKVGLTGSLSILLTNSGKLKARDIRIGSPIPPFGLSHECTDSLKVAESCRLVVSLTPLSAGVFASSIRVSYRSRGKESVLTLELLGKGSHSCWETIDSYRYASTGVTETFPKAVLKDGTGNLYVSGWASTDRGQDHWLVRKSSDNGMSWGNVDDFVMLAGTLGEMHTKPYALGLDGSGGIYAGGGTETGSGGKDVMLIRKSSDDGLSWSTTQKTLIFSGGYSRVSALGTDREGNIFSVGRAYEPYRTPYTNYHWIVQRSANSGATWTTVDDYQLSPGEASFAKGFAQDSSGSLFVVGSSRYAPNSRWIVRRSSNSGSSWGTVDDFQCAPGYQSEANAVAADRIGNVYVVGTCSNNGSFMHWIIRKSTDGGKSWATVEDLHLPNRHSIPSSIVTDELGKVYVAGSMPGVDGLWKWIVRSSVNAGETWATIDDFIPGLRGGVPTALTIDALGRPIVVGQSLGSDRQEEAGRWLVRQNICN
jgi:hypothetical protein